jgi:hypothetical protein
MVRLAPMKNKILISKNKIKIRINQRGIIIILYIYIYTGGEAIIRGYRLFWGIGPFIDSPLDSIDIYMIDSMLLWMMIMLFFLFFVGFYL